MKKLVLGLVAVKSLFLAAMLFAACQTAQLSDLNNANAVATASPTPVVADANINRPTSEPYTGDLSIFEGEQRAANLQIDRVMDILKISEGKLVADIGAGSGWFTVRAAQRASAGGKVYAVEISEDAIKYINERAARENFTNIQTVLGTEDNPKLPENSIDAVMILKTYHEIAQPVKVLLNLRKSLKKDALVGVIDRNGTGADHGIQMETVIEEFKKAGYEKIADYDFVKPDGMDYFLVFKLKD